MELRVVVIAVIALIIVSMSLVIKTRPTTLKDWRDGEVDLLETGAPTVPSVRRRVPEDLFKNGAPANLIDYGNNDDARNSDFERLNAHPRQSDDIELLEQDEPLQITPNKLGDHSPSIPELAQTESPTSLTPVESSPLPEVFPVADSPQQPVAIDHSASTTWQSSVAESPVDPSNASELVRVDANPLETDLATAVPALSLPSPELSPPTSAEQLTENSTSPDDSLISSTEKTARPIQDIPASVTQIARNHLRYGNTLARRGSLFSARQEFLTGLRLVIESLDLVNGSDVHREHYRLAITALNEAEDFSKSTGDEASLSVSRIVDLHQSKVLNDPNDPSLTPMSAMQSYYAYAQEHFSAACARSPVASEILFALGKLHTVMAVQEPTSRSTDLAIAILMHQAALNVDPHNHLSANELGVALARLGHYESARAALLHSVAAQPTPEAWLNLSIVHQALGETKLAELALAEQKAAMAARGFDGPYAQRIRWMAPDEFAAAQQVAYQEDPTVAESPATTPSAEPRGDSRIWTRLQQTFGTR
jgi:tetratricopeptide (TPR) repeat protein